VSQTAVSRTTSQATVSVANKRPQPVHRASIIVINYNGRAYLATCLRSLLSTVGEQDEIIVVDNNSTDGSIDIVTAFPTVEVVRSSVNRGFGDASNLGGRPASGRYLVFVNQDTIPAPGWLEALLRVLDRDPKVGLATSKILLLNDPDSINTAGNNIHLSGLTLCRGMGLPAEELDDPAPVGAASGAAFAIRRDLFFALGGFDADFFMYMEDTDISLRAQLAGYTCQYVPDSIVYHDYELRFGPNKTYYQELNRYLMYLKSLRWGTLLLLLPALLLAEIVTWGHALLEERGRRENKLRAYAFVGRHWPSIAAKRRETQSLRRVPDRLLLERMTFRLDFDQIRRDPAARLAGLFFDPLFWFWRRFLLIVLRW
jgi:GT2 family glycosyltransferase